MREWNAEAREEARSQGAERGGEDRPRNDPPTFKELVQTLGGRGKEEACKRSEEEPAIPESHLDFMFMGEEVGGKTLAMLVAREKRTKALICSVVPRMTTGQFIAKRVVAFMSQCGCEMSQIIMKSDNEAALVAIVDEVARVKAARGASALIENSPAYSSKSNGVIERGVQTIQGMIRTLRSCLEEKWGVTIDTEHAIWSWVAEYAGWLVNRCEVGRDGRTPYEKSKGKKARIPGMEFGEGVLWKRKPVGGGGR